MLSEEQQTTFREILDLNWELKETKEKVNTLTFDLEVKKSRLKKMMGESEYNNFINMGQRMFAPKES
jgi:hypothetical protein